MNIDYKYDVWRNYLLIIMSLLVGYLATKFESINSAILSICEYDKVVDYKFFSNIIAFLVIVYIAKNVHGILITLFDNKYYDNIKDSRFKVISFYLFTSLITISFLVVMSLIDSISYSSIFIDRTLRLFWFTFFPSAIYFFFDLIHPDFILLQLQTR